MIKINNLEDEKTQEILLDLGFYKRKNYNKGIKYNIWIKEVKTDDEKVDCSFLINTAFVHDDCLRVYIGIYEELDDIGEYEVDAVSTDNELDFLMQMFNSGLSIERVKYIYK